MIINPYAYLAALSGPADLQNLVAWWDASDDAVLTYSSGTTVSQWDDKSGNGHHLTVADATGPDAGSAINGVRALRFNDTPLECSTLVQAQPLTVFMAFNATIGGVVFDGDDVSTRLVFTLNTNSRMSWNGGTQITSANGTAPITTGVEVALIANGASSLARWDRTQIVAGNIGTSGIDGFVLGEAYTLASGADIRIGEVVIIGNAATAQELQDVELYLTNKWGVGPVNPGPWLLSGSTTVVEAGSTGNHHGFPGLCLTGTGDLLIAYRDATTHSVETTASIVCETSTDGGSTWSATSTVVDTASFDDRDPCLTSLANGNIICSFFTHDGAYQTGVVQSSDDGATWGAPVMISSAALTGDHAASGPVIELPNGDLLLGLYGLQSGDSRFSIVITRSTDDGATWSDLAVAVDGMDYGYSCFEPNLLLLSDGSVFCGLRTRGRIAWTRSTNSGATWSTPVVIEASSSTGRPAVIETSDGSLIWASRISGANFFQVSEDFGASWYGRSIIESGTEGAYQQMVETSPNVIAMVHAMEGAGSEVRFSYIYRDDLSDPMP